MENHNKEDIQQVIIINKNLNMPCEKIAVQVARASLLSFLEYSERTQNSILLEYRREEPQERWINTDSKIIVLYVKSEETLFNVFKKARERGLPSVLVQDLGYTFFKEPTYTAVGIGPVYKKDLEGITNRLQTLKY